MPITNSQIISTSVQADGSRLVHERHTDHNGFNHEVQYFAPANWDINAVLSLRAQNIGAEIDSRELMEAEAMAFEVPITLYQFMSRFTPTERKLIRTKEKVNEDLADFLDFARSRNRIYLKSSRTAAAMNLLVALGCITAARADEVLQ